MSGVMRVVVASANPHKVAELRDLLGAALPGLLLVARPPDGPDVDESESTLEGNAFLKARALVAFTGEAAIADDTGLFVAALHGAPGVHTARYGGPNAEPEANRAKLLATLDGLEAVTASARRAEFRTVIVLVGADGSAVTAEGSVEGWIASSAIGGGGFGYDSVFIPLEGDGRSFAEMSESEKHALSHRGRAIRALAAKLGSPTP